MSNTPYIGFGHSTLDDCLPLQIGQTIRCPHCGGRHVVEGSTNMKTGKVSDLLLAYQCPKTGKTYLAGVNGKSVMGIEADASGEIGT